MATSSPPSSSSPPPPQPLQSISPPPPPPKPKPTPSPWSHTETVHLIAAYRHKWYSLNRGQLKATQWQHLSDSLSTPKTATQCRHKIEKLRKRYRAERNKPNPRAWEYFDLMHALHNGSGAAVEHALPIAMVENPNTIRNVNCESRGRPKGWSGPDYDDKDDDDDVNEGSFVNFPRHVGSVGNNPNLMRFGPGVRRPRTEVQDEEEAVNLVSFAKSNSIRDRRGYVERSDSSESEGEEREERGLALAGEIRHFAERVLRMEERKMEMMRETERYRMEMEKRTTEMIRESQRKVVDTIARAFGSRNNKKMKTEMD